MQPEVLLRIWTATLQTLGSNLLVLCDGDVDNAMFKMTPPARFPGGGALKR
ncbi:MAG: hypothetical protein ABJG96_16135 [Paracoccaceae bacterium]